MKYTLCFIALVANLVPLVMGHGWVAQLVIDGKSYPGNDPFIPQNAVPSPIRLVNSSDPVRGAQNPFMGCGLQAKPAALIADANPGSKVDFHWLTDIPDKLWIHMIGPAITYMAKCDTSCDTFNSNNAKWFKVDQQAQPNPRNLSHWIAEDVHNGAPVTVTLPKNVAPGGYLLRHELIGLHSPLPGGLGPEYYPSCSQINIASNSNPTVNPSQTVSFPGAYTGNEPGITLNVFVNPNIKPYDFPGPALSNVVNGSGAVSASTGSTTVPANTGSATTVSAKASSSVVPPTTSSATSPTKTTSAVVPAKSKCTTPKRRSLRSRGSKHRQFAAGRK
ncbi:lytic polysaccharide monooxygenase [Sphaerobolus stellatus SS14]|uniref:lytic cellulose monooxygenase (C4-dehydrogenating) n=1 Tax=Sphaerobolus stellatus (strain SS14) TaxID=990650 RepID=A0A0C9U6M8_SPHS4|nr:lytic polysaccharide monooxygenase [Sphaerobolus stellatus SS14]